MGERSCKATERRHRHESWDSVVDLLDIVLNYDCNLKCTYCTITDEMRGRRELPIRDITTWIDYAASKGCRALSLTGGEPTIRQDLLGLIRYARGRGFDDIKIQTNGLLFGEVANVHRALDAGVTRVGVSIHGYDGSLSRYASTTQSDEPSAQLMLAAIDHLVRAPVALTVDMIVMTETVGTLLSSLKDFHQRGVEAMNLWLVSLTDKNRTRVDSLPRISDIQSVLMACFDYGKTQGIDVRSLHVPRCMLPDYEEHVRHPGSGMDVQVVTPDAEFQLSKSRLSGGVKPERCEQCIYNEDCPGLRSDYVAHFGHQEITPVQ